MYDYKHFLLKKSSLNIYLKYLRLRSSELRVWVCRNQNKYKFYYKQHIINPKQKRTSARSNLTEPKYKFHIKFLKK